MKAPLFFFFVVCLVCVFSSCGKGKCYYHSEIPCGKIYGDVKKVTDTIYNVADGEITYPLQTNEYHFDSLNRLAEVRYCIYRMKENENESGTGMDILVSYQQMKKYRYDLNGRKVECRTTNYTCENDTMHVDNMLEHLVRQDGNYEKWEATLIHENGETSTAEEHWQYEKDRSLVDIADEKTQGNEQIVRIFDNQGNLIEFRSVEQSEQTLQATYKYNANNQLIQETSKSSPSSDETYTIYFEMDEFDNEGNWLKRTRLNEYKEVLSVTRRRIEYRL